MFDRRRMTLPTCSNGYFLEGSRREFYQQFGSDVGDDGRRGSSPSSCSRFDCITIVRGIVDREIFCISREQPRKDAVLFDTVGIVVGVAVHETIHHGRMSVDIDEEVQFEFLESVALRSSASKGSITYRIFVEIHNVFLDSVNLWMRPVRWIAPHTVEIKAQ